MACSPYHASNTSWLSLCMAASYKLKDEEKIYVEKKTGDSKEDETTVASLICFETLDRHCSGVSLSEKSKKTNSCVSPTKRTNRVVNRKARYIVGIPATSKRDSAWNVIFRRLQEFKHEYGHCNVPQGYSRDPELATWVKNQRQAYRYMLEKKEKKRISPDRITRLSHIGFEWRKYVRAEEWKATLKQSSRRRAPSTKTDVPIDRKIKDELVCDEGL
mmetsp:Transcript_13550/g.19997  ORF Transcript_13550/g.19997 Transcript_13550/m.19997 type:complete len:217 (-) Transcript_13550:55-705(-)